MKNKIVSVLLLSSLITSSNFASLSILANSDISSDVSNTASVNINDNENEKVLYNLESIDDLHYEEGSREEALLSYLKNNPEQDIYFMSGDDFSQYEAYKKFTESDEFKEMDLESQESIENLVSEKEEVVLRQGRNFNNSSIVPMFNLPSVDDFKRYSKQRARDVLISAAHYLERHNVTKMTGLFLANSLQDRPSSLYYDNNSYIANLIKYNSADFQTKKHDFALKSGDRYDGNIIFSFRNNRDLFLSVHKADMAMKKIGNRDIKCYIHDIYNFEYWNWVWFKNATWDGVKDTAMDNFIVFVNNTASFLEDTGIINLYYVNINFMAQR
jgi:hypothetical protein